MTSRPSTEPFLVRFYDPNIQAKDRRGRTRSSIVAWGDDELEYHHDYIQLLFPLPEGSPFNPSAPVIDEATFNAFRSKPELQDQLRSSLERMLQFYGFQFSRDTASSGDQQECHVVTGANYGEVSKYWVRRFNHNHLRITRILRSLRVLGLEKEAKEFLKALTRIYEGGEIGETSMMFWKRAVERPLYLAPEDEVDDGRAPDFLYNLEGRKKTSFEEPSEHSNGGREKLVGAKDETKPVAENEHPASNN